MRKYVRIRKRQWKRTLCSRKVPMRAVLLAAYPGRQARLWPAKTCVSRSDNPRFSVTISAPPTLSLAAKERSHYTFTAQLHYHSESGNQPITLRNSGLPCSGWIDEERYLFRKADDSSVAEGFAVDHEFPDYELDDEPVLVRAENGFCTIAAGETIKQDVQIWLRWWFGLEVGGRYKRLMPWAYIGWWDYGPMEVRLNPARALFRYIDYIIL